MIEVFDYTDASDEIWATACRDVQYTLMIVGKTDPDRIVDELEAIVRGLESKHPDRRAAFVAGLIVLADAPIPFAISWRRGSA